MDKYRIKRRKTLDWRCRTCGYKKELCVYREYLDQVIKTNQCPKCRGEDIEWISPVEESRSTNFLTEV